MKTKLQIFVSSTFEDLKKERQLVMSSILELGHIPAGMEYFVSDDIEQFEVIKKWINESDAYILIVGGRYGSICNADQKKRSYTHLEYEYARQIKKPIKILLLDNQYLNNKLANGVYTEKDIKSRKLSSFRKQLGMCNIVSSENDVKSEAKTVINDLSNRYFMNKTKGWIRAEKLFPLLDVHSEIYSYKVNKKILGTFHIYYFSTYHNRYVHSIISITNHNKSIHATLKNDVCLKNEKYTGKYTYKGFGEIIDNYLCLELKNTNDNERVYLGIKILPDMKVSIGILVAQTTMQQLATTSFVLSKDEITDEYILEEFRNDQIAQFKETEKIVIDENSINYLIENIKS